MTRLGWIVVLGIIALAVLIAGAIWWFRMQMTEEAPRSETLATTTPVTDPSQLAIYTNGQYGFSFFYPANAVLTDSFGTTSKSNVEWRVSPLATGTPIVHVKATSGEIRVGVSSSAKEVTACLSASPAEEARGTFTVGSTTWREFMFEKLGTDNELSVVSYRIVKEKKCYAVEVFTPLAGTAPAAGYTVKDAITSFTFAH